MKTKTISISKDFSKFPAGRYETDGPFTGEGFRKKLLVPALTKYDQIIVELDNALGYGSSFLEEAFGGLIREEGYNLTEIQLKIQIKCARISTIESIKAYLQSAQNEK